jgi:hypothetical protein
MTDIRPKADFDCPRCNGHFESSYYAIDLDDRKICDDCAHAWQLSDLETHDRSTVYGPADVRVGATVSNWPGQPLGTIISVGAMHHWTQRSIWGPRWYCRIETVNGVIVGGYIGAGLASNVKRLAA